MLGVECGALRLMLVILSRFYKALAIPQLQAYGSNTGSVEQCLR